MRLCSTAERLQCATLLCFADMQVGHHVTKQRDAKFAFEGEPGSMECNQGGRRLGQILFPFVSSLRLQKTSQAESTNSEEARKATVIFYKTRQAPFMSKYQLPYHEEDTAEVCEQGGMNGQSSDHSFQRHRSEHRGRTTSTRTTIRQPPSTALASKTKQRLYELSS